jgi:predicted nucleic-acid-binding protein
MEAFTAERQGFIALTALVETAWVLTSCYGIDKDGLIRVLEALLRTKTLLVEKADTVRRALSLFRTSKADLEDCLILCSCHAAGCEETLTFDGAAGKLAGMRLLR